MPEQSGIPVKLGEYDYRVVEQRHAYLRRNLSSFMESLENLSTEELDGVDGILDLVGDRIYELLSVFIPDLMPKWEFDGYGSPGAAERGDYEEEADRSPTQPQIIEALTSCMKVNRFDWLKHVQNLMGGDFLRVQMRAALAGWAAEQAAKGASTTSPNLPQPSGESDQTTSGQSDPTEAATQVFDTSGSEAGGESSAAAA